MSWRSSKRSSKPERNRPKIKAHERHYRIAKPLVRAFSGLCAGDVLAIQPVDRRIIRSRYRVPTEIARIDPLRVVDGRPGETRVAAFVGPADQSPLVGPWTGPTDAENTPNGVYRNHGR